MFTDYFRITATAVGQIFILAAIGYFLVKKNILGSQGLDALSRLVVEITLPLMIFCKLLKDFTFAKYPGWWVFPLASILITACGFLIGGIFSIFFKGRQHKLQFLGLVAFQNSGYLPLGLITALLSKEQADQMFIYLFLILMGFNLLVWSLGVYLLTFHRSRKFELGSLFSPPVAATVFTLVLIFFSLNRFIPDFLYKPLKAVGDCTVPLALFIVGGSLALVELKKVDKKAVVFLILAKNLILPAAGFLVLLAFNIRGLIGLLIMMQLAMPSATTLSLIIRHYKKEDLFISQGVFFSHLAGVITIPVFLSLYFALSMIK